MTRAGSIPLSLLLFAAASACGSSDSDAGQSSGGTSSGGTSAGTSSSGGTPSSGGGTSSSGGSGGAAASGGSVSSSGGSGGETSSGGSSGETSSGGSTSSSGGATSSGGTSAGTSSSGGSGGGRDERLLACNENDGVCEESYGSGSLDLFEESCTLAGGTVIDSCPTENLSGVCTFGNQRAGIRTFYYGLSEQAVMTVREACEIIGTWSTTP